MSTRLINKIRVVRPDVKDTTIQAYIRSLKMLSVTTLQNLKDSNSIISKLDKIENSTTRKNVLTAILVACKAYKSFPESILKKYVELHTHLNKIQQEGYLDNEKSTKEKKNWITKAEILIKKDEIQNKLNKINRNVKRNQRKYLDLTQQLLVLDLYTLLPPLRNDYVGFKVVEVDVPSKQGNYLVLSQNKFIFSEYKTAKTYGIIELDIPSKLMKTIKEWLMLQKSSFLLINTTNGTPMTENGLTHYLNKIFAPKKVSTTMLRKIYLSEKYPVVQTYREHNLDAKAMGHSVSTQKLVYSKK